MRHLEIIGYGTYLPSQEVSFKGQIRHRVVEGEDQLDIATIAAQRALEKAGIVIDQVDCIVSASAVGVQPIPSTAALIHERIAKGTQIPALDINTTCTSFISALDTMSYLMDVGRYETVLIVSSEVGSRGLNPNQEESYKLFSDGAAAMIFRQSKEEKGIIVSEQRTWSEGAHSTEIRGGLTGFEPRFYSEETKEEYMFDMKGPEILKLSIDKVPAMFQEFLTKNDLSVKDIDLAVPHQASPALRLVMRKLGFKKDQYMDRVAEYGNMVSVSVPFMLCLALDEGLIASGDKVMLMGTAAGLTTNILLMQF